MESNVELLVVGASGFIGSALCYHAAGKCSVAGTYWNNDRVKAHGCRYYRMDVASKRDVESLLNELKPRVVVHAAGTKDIEFCEREPEIARLHHEDGTRNLVEACGKIGSKLVYVSTDCVFNGKKEKCSEKDRPAPINSYGRAKLAGEGIVLRAGLRNPVVVRTSLLFGWCFAGQAFNTAAEVVDRLEKKQAIYLPTTLFNTPLYVGKAAEVFFEVSFSNLGGVFHLSGDDRISRYELATSVAEILDLDGRLIHPAEKTKGLRPANSCLDSSKLKDKLEIRFGGIADGLKTMKSDRLCLASKFEPGIYEYGNRNSSRSL